MDAPAATYPLLESIDSPADLRALNAAKLPELAQQLRQFLIHSVATRGGHFAAGLGTVELTIALHYVFNTPYDRLVWDVGHQAYPHKVLTGRRAQLHTIKQDAGLAPFPARSESEYDTFGVGHSSTSISAALGMAVAAAQRGEDRKVVAIIGDGALTAGMAFEALNHAGSSPTDLLTILNDNDMSISENVGAMSNYLARALSGRMYSHLRESGKKVLQKMPTVWELARRSEEHLKGMVLPGTLFEELGFNYVGPIDGHDVKALVSTLRNLRKLKGPQFLHVVTRKGKGYAPAEADPIKWHGPGPFDPVSGMIFKEASTGPTYSQIFGKWLCDMAERDPSVVGITPAMREGSGLVEYSKRFPDRYFDVAIAEQHAVTFAAGLATEGIKPVVAIYSTFLQRAYDQLIHDVALQNLPVIFAVDRAGLVGSDGATHQGSYDLSFLRCIPNMVIMAPADENECRNMLYTGTTLSSPSVIRYPSRHGTGCAARRRNDRGAGWTGAHSPRRPQRLSNHGLRCHARLCLENRRPARRHGGEHALRETPGRKTHHRDGGTSPRHHHHRRECRDGRRRRRRGRGPGGARTAITAVSYRYSGPVHRAWHARNLPGTRGPGFCRPLCQRRRLVGTAIESASALCQ